MHYLKSTIFAKNQDLIFGFSLKNSLETVSSYGCNMSYKVGDIAKNVDQSRLEFCTALGIRTANLAELEQIHGSEILEAVAGSRQGSGDALITNRKGIALGIYVADCIPIFLYDPIKKCVAAIHAGWRGTAVEIVKKTVKALENQYGSDSQDLLAWIGPGITGVEYEVDLGVAGNFAERFYRKRGDKYLLDLKAVNLNQLLECGLSNENIEISSYSTFTSDNMFHSFRRDGLKAGRHLGVICLV